VIIAPWDMGCVDTADLFVDRLDAVPKPCGVEDDPVFPEQPTTAMLASTPSVRRSFIIEFPFAFARV
jgi:hypothetical protein